MLNMLIESLDWLQYNISLKIFCGFSLLQMALCGSDFLHLDVLGFTYCHTDSYFCSHPWLQFWKASPSFSYLLLNTLSPGNFENKLIKHTRLLSVGDSLSAEVLFLSYSWFLAVSWSKITKLEDLNFSGI